MINFDKNVVSVFNLRLIGGAPFLLFLVLTDENELYVMNASGMYTASNGETLLGGLNDKTPDAITFSKIDLGDKKPIALYTYEKQCEDECGVARMGLNFETADHYFYNLEQVINGSAMSLGAEWPSKTYPD